MAGNWFAQLGTASDGLRIIGFIGKPVSKTDAKPL